MDLQAGFKAALCFLLLTIGIPGNVFILLQFTYIRLLEKKLLPTNIILMVLALVNLLIILSRVTLEGLKALGIPDLLNDSECKLAVFLFRVNRAMSICVTSLLSCYQCVLIAPRRGFWVCIKKLVTPNTIILLLILLFINLSLYPYFMWNASASRNRTTSPYTLHMFYCDVDFLTYVAYIATGSLYAFRDITSVALMTLSSSYIVYRLICHERSIKGMRSSDKSNSRSVEYKASRAVIMLVSLYVLLYGLDNSVWAYILTISNSSAGINEVRILLVSTFSAISPIVIIITNPRLDQCLLCCNGNRQQPLMNEQSSENCQPVYAVSK